MFEKGVDYYKVPEVAKELRVPRGSVYRWIAQGDMPHVRIGGLILIPRTSIEKMLNVEEVVK